MTQKIILEIRAGAGGDEAAIFAEPLADIKLLSAELKAKVLITPSNMNLASIASKESPKQKKLAAYILPPQPWQFCRLWNQKK